MATLTSKIKMCNKFRCGRWTRTTDLQDMSLTSYQLLLFRCKKTPPFFTDKWCKKNK